MAYDPSILAEHCDGDAELMRRVIELFVGDHEAQLEVLNGALARRDAERLYSVAHSIKGAAANFGAGEVLAAARAVEAYCREGRLADAGASVAELARSVRALARDLSAALS